MSPASPPEKPLGKNGSLFPPRRALLPSSAGLLPSSGGLLPRRGGIFPPGGGLLPPSTGSFRSGRHRTEKVAIICTNRGLVIEEYQVIIMG